MAGLASGNGCPRDSTAVMSLRGNDLSGGWGGISSPFTSYYLQDTTNGKGHSSKHSLAPPNFPRSSHLCFLSSINSQPLYQVPNLLYNCRFNFPAGARETHLHTLITFYNPRYI